MPDSTAALCPPRASSPGNVSTYIQMCIPGNLRWRDPGPGQGGWRCPGDAVLQKAGCRQERVVTQARSAARTKAGATGPARGPGASPRSLQGSSQAPDRSRHREVGPGLEIPWREFGTLGIWERLGKEALDWETRGQPSFDEKSLCDLR